jgi:hypothetical protein
MFDDLAVVVADELDGAGDIPLGYGVHDVHPPSVQRSSDPSPVGYFFVTKIALHQFNPSTPRIIEAKIIPARLVPIPPNAMFNM